MPDHAEPATRAPAANLADSGERRNWWAWDLASSLLVPPLPSVREIIAVHALKPAERSSSVCHEVDRIFDVELSAIASPIRLFMADSTG